MVALVVGHTLVVGDFPCKSCIKLKFAKLINRKVEVIHLVIAAFNFKIVYLFQLRIAKGKVADK